MQSLALVPLLIVAVNAFCPLNSIQSPSRPKCFTFYPTPMNFAQADAFCKNFGGRLASVSNAFEANIIWQNAQDQSNTAPAFWLGGNDVNSPGQFSWIDGTTYSYSRWAQNQPNVSNHCISTLSSNGLWTTARCDSSMPFACVANLDQTCKPPCDSEWTWNQKTNACYKVVHDVRTWDDAESLCLNMGGHLASIHNDYENSFVNTLGMSGITVDAGNQIWVGLRRGANAEFEWSDKTAVDYYHWAEGEPNNEHGKESCVESYADLNKPKRKGDYQQRWNDENCKESFRAAVCKKPTNK